MLRWGGAGEARADSAVMYHYFRIRSNHCTVSFLLAGKHLWSPDLGADSLGIYMCVCVCVCVGVGEWMCIVWKESLWCVTVCACILRTQTALVWWMKRGVSPAGDRNEALPPECVCVCVCMCVCVRGELTGLDYPLQSCPLVWKADSTMRNTHTHTHTHSQNLTTALEMMNVTLTLALSSRDPTWRRGDPVSRFFVFFL